MDYQKVMGILSQCGLGAILLSTRNEILEANELAIHLLHGEGGLTGKILDFPVGHAIIVTRTS